MQSVSVGDELFSPHGLAWKCDCIDDCRGARLIAEASGQDTWLTLDELNEQNWWNLSHA